MLRRALCLALCAALLPARLAAAEFNRIESRDEFLAAVQGRNLEIGLFGLSLTVNPDGTITGSALGWDVTGRWSWQDGYFCREMDWSGMPIPYNCQLVELRGDEMRFTVDRGAGEAARFALR